MYEKHDNQFNSPRMPFRADNCQRAVEIIGGIGLPQVAPEERRQRQMDYLRNLASSPRAEKLVEHLELPEIQAAEDVFKQALAEVSDQEARDRLDTAAGRISAAYQLLGFCVGHTTQSNEAFL